MKVYLFTFAKYILIYEYHIVRVNFLFIKIFKLHTGIRFRAFIIRTMAASISCFRSSSTLLRVSLLSGSDSPFAATVWIFTLHKTM